MSQPDLLSERIEEYRAWFARYSDTGVMIEPEAMIAYDALFGQFVSDARALEERAAGVEAMAARCEKQLREVAAMLERADRALAAAKRPALPLDRVVAELDEEARATDAFAASLARSKDRIVAMRAAQDNRDATEKAVLDGVETGKVALFPIVPRPVFGVAASRGNVPVEDAIDFLAAITRDAPKSRFSDAPSFDTPEDCA